MSFPVNKYGNGESLKISKERKKRLKDLGCSVLEMCFSTAKLLSRHFLCIFILIVLGMRNIDG